MARMTRFQEPIKVELEQGWSLVGASGGLYGDGTRCDIHLYNGTLKDSEIVSLSLSEMRDTYATGIASMTGLNKSLISCRLLDLKDILEGLLRILDEEALRKPETRERPSIVLDNPLPWDDEVDGEKLIENIQAAIERFLILPPGASYASALWALFTYVIDAVDTAPILMITSPEPQCGKSTMMGLLLGLTSRPIPASNITPAALYRTIEEFAPTLIIDEADSFMRQNDELRGVINSGHTRQLAFVIRCDGDDREPRSFSTWAAKAIAGIGGQAHTIMDRSIEVPMRRRLPDEKIQKFRMERLLDFEPMRRQCVRWANDNMDAVRAKGVEPPDFLSDRAGDNWQVLLKIASVAGESSLTEALKSLRALCGREDSASEPSVSVMLLEDMREFFKQSAMEHIASDDLVTFLHDIEDRPWGEFGRLQKPITKRQAAGLLKPFGIRPKTVRAGYKNAKGYALWECQDSFFRYLPPPSVTPSQSSNGAGLSYPASVTQTGPVTDKNTLKPSNGADCDGVTDPKLALGEETDSEIVTEWF